MSNIALSTAIALPILAAAAESSSMTGLVDELMEVGIEVAVVGAVFVASTVIFTRMKGRKSVKAHKKSVGKTAKPQLSGKLAEVQKKIAAAAQGPLPGGDAVFSRLAQEGMQDDVDLDSFLNACAAKTAWTVAARALASGAFDNDLCTESYNMVMQGFANGAQLTPCVNLCKDMRAKGLEPSATTYGILLEACLNGQDFLRAQSLLLDISKAGNEVKDAQCHACYKGLVAASQTVEAEELVAALPSAFDSATLARLKSESAPRTRIAKPTTPPSKDGVGNWRGEAANWRDRSTATDASAPRAASHGARLAQFIEVNKIDAGCVQMLQKLSPAQAEWVMDQEFIISVDSSKGSASAKAVAAAMRSKQKSAEFWAAYPQKEDLSRRLAAFVQINGLDRRCASTIEQLSEENQTKLMNQEFIVSVDPQRGTASSKVIWQVLRMRNNQH